MNAETWRPAVKWGIRIGLIFGAIALGILQLEGWMRNPAVVSELASHDIALDKIASGTQLYTDSIKADRSRTRSQLDPTNDGWHSEVVAEQAKKQILYLCQRLAGQNVGDSLANEVSNEVVCNRLRQSDLRKVVEGGNTIGTVILRSADLEYPLTFRGREEFAKELRDLAHPFTDATDVHVHAKVVRVTTTPTSATTISYLEASGRTNTGALQQHATWHCEWEKTSNDALLLTSVRVSDFEEISVTGPWFVDSTNLVLGLNRSFRDQLAFGHHYWLSQLSKSHGISVFTRSGMALGDVNGDGLDDVYVCQPGGLPNRLLLHQPDGTALEHSSKSSVDWLDHTSSALIVDLDNDHDQDLVVATTAGLLVMENDGNGQFELRETLVLQNTDVQSLSAVDYDSDGDLDIYTCIEFANGTPADGVQFVYHNAIDGAANILFRNDLTREGDWRFSNVTEEVGLDEDNRRHSLACAWEDYDNDGDQDLYVANDYGPNCLYENDHGQFTNVAADAHALDSASGMSVSWGDYNGDGWMDLYVANMFSSAGNRITRQAEFMPGADEKLRNVYSRFAKGNTLLENNGKGQFREVSGSAGVEMGRWAWGSVFADINNDCWEDLLVANGYITTDDSGDL